MSGTEGWSCAAHPRELAEYRCDGCEALLCGECIEEGTHLLMCRLCGERALPLGAAEPPQHLGSAPRLGVRSDSVRMSAPEEADLLTTITNHVVVPVAIIAMVTALLFFLVDVRSIFLPYGSALKWLGFWFVIGTVLIERYGRVSAQRERQGCYTMALAGAMVLVLVLEPWERHLSDPVGILANLVIVGVVWRYATRLTRSLARESEEKPSSRKLELYGVARLEFEAWERNQEDARLQAKRQLRAEAKAGGQADAHGNPSAAVARLAVVALVIFAMAEPLVLAGPPEVGERALAATIVFLLSAALVLAAGSTVGTLRHAQQLGGRVTEGLVPRRVALAGFLAVVLLAVVLAVPGIAYRGTGELEPELGVAEDVDAPTSERGESEAEDAPSEASGGSSNETETAREPVAAATAMIDLLAKIGRFLWIPFLIAVILGGLYVLSRLAPFLKPERLKGWRSWLARLAAALGKRRFRRRKRGGRRRAAVELDLDGLASLSPREAVITGYVRMLETFVDLGYERPERQTPYEFVESLPSHLRHLRSPLDGLTSLYVRAAYGSEDLEERDGKKAVSILAQIKSQLPSPAH